MCRSTPQHGRAAGSVHGLRQRIARDCPIGPVDCLQPNWSSPAFRERRALVLSSTNKQKGYYHGEYVFHGKHPRFHCRSLRFPSHMLLSCDPLCAATIRTVWTRPLPRSHKAAILTSVCFVLSKESVALDVWFELNRTSRSVVVRRLASPSFPPESPASG